MWENYGSTGEVGEGNLAMGTEVLRPMILKVRMTTYGAGIKGYKERDEEVSGQESRKGVET